MTDRDRILPVLNSLCATTRTCRLSASSPFYDSTDTSRLNRALLFPAAADCRTSLPVPGGALESYVGT